MTERLDRIEATIERNAEAIDRNIEAIDRLFESIGILTGGFESVSNRMSQMLDIMQQTESERQAAQAHADRMMDTILDNQRKIAENENRFEILLAESRADRIEFRRRFEEEREERLRQLAEEREERQRQFEAQSAERQRRDEEWQRQITAQNEAIRALLMQIAGNNDRIDRLEAD